MGYYFLAALVSLLLSLAGLYIEIPILKKLRVGQTINEYGPQSHMEKQGMLTMGGVSFIVAGVLSALVFSLKNIDQQGSLILFCAVSTLGFGAIGFVDDYLKVVKHRSVGLTVRQKFIPQCLLALMLAVLAYLSSIGSSIRLPFTDRELELGFLYIPIAAFVMVAVDNSANILDGLDGLLTTNSSIALGAMSLYAFYTGVKTGSGGMTNVGVFCLCMCFAVFGFLRHNTNPAKIMMGDVGSLGIGGALAGAAICCKSMLMLPFMLVTMLISSLSDILQIIYMRRHQGRKLMRMSPLHHHLELGGMPETHIVSLYSIFTLIGCAVALIMFA